MQPSSYLVVGDYHAEPSDLSDCRRLAGKIGSLARQLKVPVLFTGDQYHTHAVIHAEVQLFWFEFYEYLKTEASGSISIVGNHDKPGSASSRACSMIAHTVQTEVIRAPTLHSNILFLPYYDDPEEFLSACEKSPEANIVFCHQTFSGSKYENGFYAKDGINPDLVPQSQIISGHIHAPQKFGKVWYVGAPRWRTISDANTERHIYLVTIYPDGSYTQVPYDTGLVCRKIYSVEDTELKPALDTLDPAHEWNVDIHGTGEWIEKRLPIFKKQGARVRTFKVQLEQHTVKESEGLEEAYSKWIEEFKPQYGTPKDELKLLSQERTKHGR